MNVPKVPQAVVTCSLPVTGLAVWGTMLSPFCEDLGDPGASLQVSQLLLILAPAPLPPPLSARQRQLHADMRCGLCAMMGFEDCWEPPALIPLPGA